MRAWRMAIILLLALGLSGCGGGGGDDNADVLAYVALEVGNSLNFEVQSGVATLTGVVTVVAIDPEYVDGLDAYKVETKQSGFLQRTAWYDVTAEGLFLLGEEVVEDVDVVERTFTTPLKVLPYPLESETGVPVQFWSTTSDMLQGGSETHRYDNSGKGNLTTPGGTFQAFHLVHTRSVTDGASTQTNEYFVPTEGFVQFEYPDDSQLWQLAL